MSDGANESRKLAVAMTCLACCLLVAIVFASFCVMELLVIVFTGGSFSLSFPAFATAAAIFGILALLLLTGGGAR